MKAKVDAAHMSRRNDHHKKSRTSIVFFLIEDVIQGVIVNILLYPAYSRHVHVTLPRFSSFTEIADTLG
jgi:hypothetical protein